MIKILSILFGLVVFACGISLSSAEANPHRVFWLPANYHDNWTPDSIYPEKMDLTPSVSAEIPNYKLYTNSHVKAFLKAREGLVMLVSAHATYGGKIIASYDFRRNSRSDTNLSRDEIKAIWYTNMPLLKADYFRGKMYCFKSKSLSEQWITAFSSPDMRNFVFARDDGPILFSQDSGLSWSSLKEKGSYEFVISSTVKGSLIMASFDCTDVSDFNFFDDTTALQNWYAVVRSAKGSKLVFSSDSVNSAPVLSISSENGFVVLSWPITSSDYQLQMTSDLAAANWNDVTNSSAVSERLNKVNLPANLDNNFFRLRVCFKN